MYTSYRTAEVLQLRLWISKGLGGETDRGMYGPVTRQKGSAVSLLYDAQKALLDENAPVGPTLLKIRFLASRLGVPILEDWVAHEIDGYPQKAEVPDYRICGVSYYGTFVDMVRQIPDFVIPPYLISKHAGDGWNTFKIRDGMSVVEDAITRLREKTGEYHINASNLILAIQGHVFEDMSCIRLYGKVSPSSFVAVQSAIRAKALNLTIAIEKAVPTAGTITVGPLASPIPPAEVAAVNERVSQIIVHGNYNQVVNSGTSGAITVSATTGDVSVLTESLKAAGLPEPEAKELAGIVEAEKPDDPKEPLGKRARAWMADKAEKFGVALAIEGVKLAVKGYYG